MSTNEYIAIINNKEYRFTQATKVFIINNADSYGMKEKDLIPFTNKVHDLYLSDSNDTPLDKLCDYCFVNWKKIRNKSRWDILNDFYLSI